MSIPPGASIVSPGSILDFLVSQQVREGARNIQGFNPLAVWDARSRFLAGSIVIWQGGWWLALVDNEGSRPISGNTDWTLVAGTPYVRVTLDEAELVAAPFVDAAFSGPGVTAIPAAGAGLVAWPKYYHRIVGPGTAWDSDPGVYVAYDSAAGQAIQSALPTELAEATPSTFLFTPENTDVIHDSFPGDLSTQPIVLVAASGAAPADGTRSLLIEIGYQILPTTI